jgi:hypothetical protein
MLSAFPGITHLAKEQWDEVQNGSEILILCHQAIGLELYFIRKKRSFWNLPYSPIRAEKGGGYNKKMGHAFGYKKGFYPPSANQRRSLAAPEATRVHRRAAKVAKGFFWLLPNRERRLGNKTNPLRYWPWLGALL